MGSLLASWALLREALPGVLLVTGGLLGITVLLLVAQALSLAPALPGPDGLLRVALGMAPGALAVGLPIGILAGVTAAGRAWVEGGDALALAASGLSARALLPGLLLLGLLGTAAEAGLTHHLEPTGRAAVRQALTAGTGSLRLRPGQPLTLGGVLLHARAVLPDGRYAGLFVAAEDVVLGAAAGEIAPGGVLRVWDGAAADLHSSDGGPGGAGWWLEFGTAEVALGLPTRRVELVERSDAALRDLIGRMAAEGRAAPAETLVLYKRTSLPLSVLLLALLGLPLGMRGWRPAGAAVGVTLGWWAATRLCDQAVGSLGPLWAAVLPLGLLVVLVGLAWGPGWRER